MEKGSEISPPSLTDLFELRKEISVVVPDVLRPSHFLTLQPAPAFELTVSAFHVPSFGDLYDALEVFACVQ